MSEVTAILEAGEKLGLTGEQLRQFVKEQQDEARNQRALDRELDKEKLRVEQEREKEKLELEKEKLRVEQEREKERQELEKEKLRVEQEREKDKQSLEKEKLKLKQERLELERQKSEHEKKRMSETIKLPFFDEKKDKFDTYVTRFESLATMQKLNKEEWAVQLSLLLTGDALEALYALPTEEQGNYDKIKESLLRKYSMTEDEFRKQFFDTLPSHGETIQYFTARLERTFTKWVEAAKIKKDYKGLSELIIREGLYKRCSPELTAFLREKAITELPEIVTAAQRYVDAHSCCWSKGVSGKKAENRTVEQKTTTEGDSKLLCTVCKKQGHTDSTCWFRDNNSGTEKKCFRCGSTDHLIKNCTQEKESIGSSSVINEQHHSPIQEKYKNLSAEALSKVLNVPISQGTVNGQSVMVMRDTGFASAAVRSSLVKQEDYLDEYEDVYLMDCTQRKFRKAIVDMETKHFSGPLKVLVVDSLVVDCVLGNAITQEEDTENTENDKDPGSIASVVTRAKEKEKKKAKTPLIVEESELADRHKFMKLQKEDKSLSKYWDLAGGDEVQKKYGSVRFEVKKDLLYRRFTPLKGGNAVKQLVVPKEMREKVISVAHDGLLSGHCGIKRTKDRVLSNFYWRDIDDDVQRFCRSCKVCQKTLPKGRQGKAPLQRMPVIGEPFRRVAVDLVGPIVPCSERGHRYLLTVVDYATKYPEAEALKTIDAISVAEALVNIFCRIGFPQEMLTDRGTQFMSELMKEVNRLLSVKHLNTTAWHPQCNGLVERFNGTLKTILKRLCSECPKQWDRYLPAVLFAYRTSIQESSGFSPFELVFGRKVRGPMEILQAYWGREEEEEIKNVYKYVVDLKQRLQETCDIAQEELLKAQEVNKKHYDKSAKPKVLEVGQKVLLLLPTKPNKLLLQWRGPYTVVEKMSPVNYMIQVGSKRKNFHVNMLKLYYDRKMTKSEENSHQRDGESEEKPNSTDVSEETDSNQRSSDESDSTESDTDSVPDEEMTTDSEERVTSKREVVANSVVLNDGDTEDSELIEVCPLSSVQTWEDVKVNPQLTQQQRQQVAELLQEEAEVLTTLPGHTSIEEHTIELTTDEPVRAKSYPIPYTQREVIAKEVEEMMKMKIIRPSKSPYAAPPVIVRKPDGTNRFCVNYKKLNTVTIFDGEPMPCPDDVYIELRGKKYRTKMDLTKGYWQISIHPNSIEKTAFVTPDGVYEFLRLPFGLKNSAATFNRMMRKVIGNLKGVGCFVDDVIVHTDTWDEHLATLREVFKRLKKAGLTVKPSKCIIGVTDVEFVGHKVGIDTLEPRKEKVEEVLNVEKPKTRRQVKSYLAMAGYYAKFIKNFSDITYPLTELTKAKPGKFYWGDKEDQAFQEIKRQLSQEPILRIVNFQETMYVQTDASDVGLGAALLQRHEGVLHPVRYVSRKLKPAERNYSTVEKEGLGVVWAIEKLRIFLYGREFVLLVDHKPLTFINKTKFANNRVMRWSLFLQDWSFRVESIKGVDNLLADYLSRV